MLWVGGGLGGGGGGLEVKITREKSRSRKVHKSNQTTCYRVTLKYEIELISRNQVDFAAKST